MLVSVCPTCHGRFGGPLTHLHRSRIHDPSVALGQAVDPRFSGCPICGGRGVLETCETCEGTGRVELQPDGTFRPAHDVAKVLNQQATRAWDGMPGVKLRRPG